jgi:hypothetical protein
MNDREKRDKQRKEIEEADALKWKNKKEKLRQEKIAKKEALQKSLLKPLVKNNIIIWIDKDNNGQTFIGSYVDDKKKKPIFEIKRGIVTFSLKILNDKIKDKLNNSYSINLITLQKKANKILCDYLREFKPIP